MKIIIIPQRNDNLLKYKIQNEVIQVTYNNAETDEFDFRGFPDGKMFNADTSLTVEPLPIQSAKRIDGTLIVELLYFHKGKLPKERELVISGDDILEI
jgi:hypothetical protein